MILAPAASSPDPRVLVVPIVGRFAFLKLYRDAEELRAIHEHCPDVKAASWSWGHYKHFLALNILYALDHLEPFTVEHQN
jgi:hypothetical protein